MFPTAGVLLSLAGRVCPNHSSFAAKFDQILAGNHKFCSSVTASSTFFNLRHFHGTMPTQVENYKTDKPLLKVVKLTQNAFIPTKGSKHSAGYDLYSAYDYTIPPMSNVLVKTDLQISVPHGCYGRVAPRSGLAVKNFIDVGAGVVDEDYRGNLGVVLFNFGKEPFEVARGERIAQFICEKIEYPELEEVKTLDNTERGVNGFGSTGTK